MYATFFRFISPHNGIFWIKSLFWRRLSTCFALCWACFILGNNLRTKDEIFVFEEFTIINIHCSAIVEVGEGAEERACHVLRLFSISLFVRLFEKWWNIVHFNKLRGFGHAFRVFCSCLDWKVVEYLACQWVTWVLECFSCVLLVFRLKSGGISCMSISYVGFGMLFACFAGL